MMSTPITSSPLFTSITFSNGTPISDNFVSVKSEGIEVGPVKMESPEPFMPVCSTTADLIAYAASKSESSSNIYTPEKSESGVDLSTILGLQEKMNHMQDKMHHTENGMSDEWYQYKEILDMQRKRLVKAKRHRSENVSERDKLLFLDILGPKFEFIENRRIGGTSKMQMWREIEVQFNSSAEVERTYDQLRELWKRLKIATKKEIEAGRQRGFTPLPSSITRTFSLLKDTEFVDDISSSGKGYSQYPEEDNNQSSDKTISEVSDTPEMSLFNALQLSSLLQKGEDGRSLVERLSQRDVSATLTNSLSDNGDEGKNIVEKLTQNDLGLDLTITHVSSSNGAFGHNKSGEQEDNSSDSKDTGAFAKIMISSDSENLDQVEPERTLVINKSVLDRAEGLPSSSSAGVSQTFEKMSPVPDLVKLSKNPHTTQSVTLSSNSRLRDVDHSSRLTRKRKIERQSLADVEPSGEMAFSATEESLQRFKNEQEKGKLLKMQLENEQLKKELFTFLLQKLKDGDSDATAQAFKSVLS